MTLSSSAGLDASYHDRSTKPGWSWARNVVTIGTSGAIGSQDTDHPDISLAYASSTGIYTGKFPPCADADLYVELRSPLATVTQRVITAIDTTAGTFGISFYGPTGSLANPASGDVVRLTFRLRHKE